ncbi:MAG: penicillin acylase family protein [Patulibacter minatonensis]
MFAPRPSTARRAITHLAHLAVAGALLTATASAAAADVTVVRTAYGVPHITGNSFREVAYGYGRSIAEDNICTLAETYVTAAGERSRYFGAAGKYTVGGNGTTVSNLASDLVFQRIRDRGTVERLAAQAPPNGPRPEVAVGIAGYVDGYNDYLASVGGSAGVTDPSCRGKAWVRPITTADAYRRVYQLAILASTGAALEGIGTAQPPGTAKAADQPTAEEARATVRELEPGALDDNLSGIGSNAYGIGKSATRDGGGLVYGNPHFPWQGSERLYQAHLTIPGVADVSGASLMGIPLIMIGSTRGVAWSHTVSTARRFVPYELRLVPGRPTAYFDDGKVREMEREPVTVQALQPDGSTRPITRTLYSSRHGSITTSITGLKVFPWNRLTAYALYDGNAENFGRLTNTFLGMNEAQSVDDLDAALKQYQGIPWVNTIAADSTGAAYYADIGSVPGVPNGKYRACLTLYGRLTDGLQRLPILDGSRSSCLPGTDPDSAAPGILGASRMPSLRRDDHVSNMNDSYWLANPAQPLTGYPRIIGDERTQRTWRTRLGIRQLQGRIDGTDGLPGTKFDLANLQQVVWGNRVYSAELWRDGLVKGCTTRVCNVLRAWDLRDDLDSPGAVLWQRFISRYTDVTRIPIPGLSPYRQPFRASDPVNTPSGINAWNPVVQWALTEAARDLGRAGVPLDATLRTGQTVTRNGERIPLHGGLPQGGVFNAITPVWDHAKGYTSVVHGNSFIQAVHLLPGRCPELRTITTYGQSANPASPYFADQTKLYSAKGWNALPFCADDVARAAVSTQEWRVPGS